MHVEVNARSSSILFLCKQKECNIFSRSTKKINVSKELCCKKVKIIFLPAVGSTPYSSFNLTVCIAPDVYAISHHSAFGPLLFRFVPAFLFFFRIKETILHKQTTHEKNQKKKNEPSNAEKSDANLVWRRN